jgi:hypothetical protein
MKSGLSDSEAGKVQNPESFGSLHRSRRDLNCRISYTRAYHLTVCFDGEVKRSPNNVGDSVLWPPFLCHSPFFAYRHEEDLGDATRQSGRHSSYSARSADSRHRKYAEQAPNRELLEDFPKNGKEALKLFVALTILNATLVSLIIIHDLLSQDDYRL